MHGDRSHRPPCRSYSWEARQHRRNRPQWKEVEHKPHLHSFAIFHGDRIRHALSTPVKRISFWVGPLFFLGALLFVIGTTSQTYLPYWQDEWSERRKLSHVDAPFFVRSAPLPPHPPADTRCPHSNSSTGLRWLTHACPLLTAAPGQAAAVVLGSWSEPCRDFPHVCWHLCPLRPGRTHNYSGDDTSWVRALFGSFRPLSPRPAPVRALRTEYAQTT